MNSRRPASRRSKYFDYEIPSGKFNNEWAVTLYNATDKDIDSLKRIANEAASAVVCETNNRSGTKKIRGFFVFPYTKTMSLLQREMEGRGTWGVPKLKPNDMERWADVGDIIVNKQGSTPKGKVSKRERYRSNSSFNKHPTILTTTPSFSNNKSSNSFLNSSSSALPQTSKQTKINSSISDPLGNSSSLIVDSQISNTSLKKSFQESIYLKRKTAKVLPVITNKKSYFIFGSSSDEIALKMAEEMKTPYYIKDLSKYWDDYDDEKVVVILGLNSLNINCYSQIPSLLGNYAIKVPGRIWPLMINPTTVIISSYDTIDNTYTSYPVIQEIIKKCCTVIDSSSQTQPLRSINLSSTLTNTQNVTSQELKNHPLIEPFESVSQPKTSQPDSFMSRLKEREKDHTRTRSDSRDRNYPYSHYSSRISRDNYELKPELDFEKRF
ncbi:hypothetical protein EDI_168440 [Entamoeba dispar SAW760]|uniref:Uncharacterized protein n=1 Tax=Entamoeba dispar (strain ATCC PRA-260 / SAW760) TaxID=370354 RepID=B0E9F0_ENTDS|nr:uncharacterized protein EDI_168440 [Entamoeba dispar SAW760]EDR28859.1 hypothetical protein EDI_168440 [Entamoeba dispar SAW760]|eukprot:EDR28859.1 hypothetical protein EDI_168440 [Entamoeba dispar SAW760]